MLPFFRFCHFEKIFHEIVLIADGQMENFKPTPKSTLQVGKHNFLKTIFLLSR